VLVDEITQSHLEFVAMAFRSAGSPIVGSTTAGADGNVSELLLPGNLQVRITGLGVFYPDGRRTQQVGIIPDVRVVPTIAGITQGRDEVLEAAERLILQ
jgi:C-terminal processing protease CtpA/Prc